MKRFVSCVVSIAVMSIVNTAMAASLTYQTGGGAGLVDASVATTYLLGKTDGNNHLNNYGSDQILYNYRDSSSYTRSRVLIAFEDIFGAGTDQIPFGSTINSATLSIHKQNYTFRNVENIHLYRVTQDWDEYSVTWDNFDQTGSNIAHVDLTDKQTNYVEYNPHYEDWDVASMMQYWSDNPGENYGWMIVNGGNYDVYWNSEDRGQTIRPYLSVDFIPAVAPPIPEPATLVLSIISLISIGIRKRKLF